MDKKWLPLTITLGVAGVAVVTASVWPDDVEEPPLPQSLCHGALSRETAELIDDGQGGGEVSAGAWESKGGTTDSAVFKECHVLRTGQDGAKRRGLYKLVVEETRSTPGTKKDSVPLGSGFTGWALPDRAEVTLPAGCAARMGSAAPHITASLEVPSQDEGRLYRRGEEPPVDPATATRNNVTVMREVATRLAERYDCTDTG
ncbi:MULTISPECIES: hypothetical protein [Streptomyces]|uniref:DUF3558 domain-containing protein n=1 Tax=Streptomyces anulatus TaxID=1892 RepID=A0A6G3STU9_STRAQ|nr:MULTISPECIES: hypothetical protein [Streptomyces]NEB86351.1 hypothetical protein [Streptomyces anulatus]OLO32962.1 hypothetical protein PZ61_0222275 [Streptomyces sp. MNU77]OWA21775.1 hypothetical protein B9W61_22835 [Streptomyces sp. CS057]